LWIFRRAGEISCMTVSQERDMAVEANAKIGWVGFRPGEAVLKRVIVPGGVRGFLLRTGSGEAGEAVRAKALGFGFSELKTRGTLRMLFPDGKVPFSARVLASELGGEVIVI